MRETIKILLEGSDRGRGLNYRGPVRFDDVVLFIKVHFRRITECTIVTRSMSRVTV